MHKSKRCSTKIFGGLVLVAIAIGITYSYVMDTKLFFTGTNRKTTDKTTFILIVTYYRSGSTLLAEIIQQSKQVFYVYEPFIKISNISIYDAGLVCNASNGTCRKPTHLFEQSSFALGQLKYFHECKLDMLVDTFLSNNKSNDVKQHQTCMKQQDRFQCLQSDIKACKEKKKVVKTIRMSLRLLQETMINTPTMKIVYLVRDPRGINSRVNKPNRTLTTYAHAIAWRLNNPFREYSNQTTVINSTINKRRRRNINSMTNVHETKQKLRKGKGKAKNTAHVIDSRKKKHVIRNINVSTTAHVICDRYNDDFKVFDILSKLFPDRIKLVSYEEVARRPVTVTKDLYQYLDLSFNKNISRWLNFAMFSGKKNGFYKVYRSYATETANKWKVTLSKENITIIDNICGHLYDRLNISRGNG